MTDLEILHFEQLKTEVQTQYLLNHTPSFDDIARWKGIDIIYFQEDLRKKTKANISEKTFYTYFKTNPVTKLPRIDMLNLLSIYAGYVSWYDFKKNHLFVNENLSETLEISSETIATTEKAIIIQEENTTTENFANKPAENLEKTPILQNNDTDIQSNKYFLPDKTDSLKTNNQPFVKKYLWLGISALLAITVGLLALKDQIFSKEYTFSFIDADRNSKINDELEVKILKDNESPILFKVMPNEPFIYTTKQKSMKMVVSSPYYKTDTINRNLENASAIENIELKPNDYAIMLFYYSKSIKDLKKKRESLNYLISDHATIYQVFDNQFYGVETLDKQKYISLVTLPSTSLENLDVIDTQTDKNKKIVMIKFKIGHNEK